MANNTTTSFQSTRKIQINSKLLREDFDSGPVSLDEIEKGLYLGNLAAATHTETLKNYKITHILTLDSVPLPAHILEASFLTIKYIHISDMPKEDILHHFDDCINFIESALEKEQNILVHCYFGVSRSSTVVIAYIMKKYKLEYSQAYDKVKSKRKFVQPNEGFIYQLILYRRMGYKIDPQYPKYKTYRLRLAADKVRKAKILPQNFMDLIKIDPALIQESPEPIVYRCHKCRRILATKSNLMIHIKKNQLKTSNTMEQQQITATETTTISNEQENKQQPKIPSSLPLQQQQQQFFTNNDNNLSTTVATIKTELSSLKTPLLVVSSEHQIHSTSSQNSQQIQKELRKCSISEQSDNDGGGGSGSGSSDEINCKKLIFIEPIAWMKDVLYKTQGRLNCPKCNQKLGNFSWINSCPCPCGAEISPAFYLIPSKVDLSNIVQNVERTV